MATIRQTAQKLNVPAKKLLSEFSKKFPEQSWTLDSEVPEGFEESAQSYAQEYAEASGVELPKGELTTSEAAVKDIKLILESIEYGVVEAISEMRSAELVESAQLDAVSDIQIYESSYNEVWEAYYRKKAQVSQQHEVTRNQQKAKELIDLNNELGKRQGELIRTQEQFRNSQTKSHTQTQSVLDALLK